MRAVPCCRVCSCCLGGIATIWLRHAGDTPSWGFYGSKTPPMSVGLCGGLSVLCSTCSPPRPDAPKKGCLGRSGRRCERRFAMLGACRRASSVWSAWLASSVRAVAGSGANRCRVQKGGTPQGPASNDAISPLGGAEIAVRGGVAAKLQTHWVKTFKNRPFWRNGSAFWRIWYQSWCVVRT